MKLKLPKMSEGGALVTMTLSLMAIPFIMEAKPMQPINNYIDEHVQSRYSKSRGMYDFSIGKAKDENIKVEVKKEKSVPREEKLFG